jgi:hypothetical protein
MLDNWDCSPFVMNVSRIVVSAISERLLVSGIATDEPKEANGQPLPAPVEDWAWSVWLENRMDAKQDEVHTGALIDGEYFVIVDWDDERAMPRFTPHPRYTDPDVHGNGFGCKMFYKDDDESCAPLYATKRWAEVAIDERGRRTTEQRLNIYYPERIVQQVLRGGAWSEYAPDIPWVDGAGAPLGIAVIHVKNADLRCEAWDAFPLQDALNKALVDLIASADLTAFRILFAKGFYPTDDGQAPEADGSNMLKLAPGAIFGTLSIDGDIKSIEPADLSQLVDLVQNLVIWIAQVTDTPISRFLATRAVAAEGTLKQQEAPLLGKIRKRQTLFGNAWEDCYELALRLANMFGLMSLDEEIEFSTQWTPAETRDELAETQRLQLERDMGIPEEVIWAKLGYTPAEIANMRDMKDAQAQKAMEAQQALIAARPPQMMNGKGMN